jgi:hypothetical protein
VVRIDDFWYAHTARLGLSRMTPDEQWLGLTASEQAAEWEASARARFPLVVEDLSPLAPGPWLASIDAHAGAAEEVFPFVCECGQRGCAATAQLTISQFDGAPCVRVGGH